jgi:hypothetical protein
MKKLLLIITLLLIPTVVGAFTDGLLGYWPLNSRDIMWSSGSTGTVLDRSGNGRSGTFSDIISSDVAKGKVKQSFNFTKSDNGEVIIEDSAGAFFLSTMTVSVWIKSNTTVYANNGYIVSKYKTTDNNRMWALTAGTDGKLRLITSTNGTTATISSFTTNIPTEWMHVTLTTADQGDTFLVYINGVYSETITSSVVYINKTANLEIGGLEGSATSNFEGLIDDVRIYNRVLTDQEIYSIYRWGEFSKKLLFNN